MKLNFETLMQINLLISVFSFNIASIYAVKIYFIGKRLKKDLKKASRYREAFIIVRIQ